MNEDTIPDAAPNAADLGASFFDMNVFGWPWTGIVTLLTLIVYFVITFNVGRARMKYKVMAPEVDGPPEFLRVLRVQMNTLEQLVLFLPLLWLAALAARDELAAAIGLIWPISRIMYALGYYKDAKKRHVGFLLGFLVLVALFLLAGFQIIRALFIW
jgi:glutathione S-transferase